MIKKSASNHKIQKSALLRLLGTFCCIGNCVWRRRWTTDGGGVAAWRWLYFGGENRGDLGNMAWSGRNGLGDARNCDECVYLVFMDGIDDKKWWIEIADVWSWWLLENPKKDCIWNFEKAFPVRILIYGLWDHHHRVRRGRIVYISYYFHVSLETSSHGWRRCWL